MSVEQANVIDFASIDPNGNAILTISDHLPWDTENTHLLLLQDKINSYLGAIEHGELYIKYPEAKNRKIVISVRSLESPSKDGYLFLGMVKDRLNAAGYGFEFTEGILFNKSVD